MSPSITLYPVWDGEDRTSPESLICALNRFYPDKLSVEWQLDSHNLNTTTVQEKLQSMEGIEKTFSLISQIKLDKDKWKNGSIFKCISRHNAVESNQSISICAIQTSSSPSIHLETPSFKTVMTAESEVTAKCVVHTALDARVTWFIDGEISHSNNKVEQVSTTASIISNLTVSTSQWKSLSKIACKAEHRCFSTTEKTVSVKGHAVRDPSVLIRRSFPQSLKEDSAVLECHVTQISSSDLYITFQANGTGISDKQFVILPASTDLHSITRRFSVPRNYSNETTFTCTVNQGFSHMWVSNSTGKFFGDPSIELLVAPSEDQGSQKLMCSGWGFNPQIQWLDESQKISGPTSDIRMGQDGRVAVTSHLNIPQNEWKTGKIFTCEISDQSTKKAVGTNISLCSVQADDLVLIDSHWCHRAETDPDSMLNTTLTFIFLFLITLLYSIGTTIIKRVVSPSITLYPVWDSEDRTSPESLICALNRFYPEKMSVEWQLDSHNLNTTTVEEKLQSMEGVEKTFSRISQIKLDKDKWKKGSIFKCISRHNAVESNQSISICTIYQSASPSINLETPSFKTVMTAESEVKATCVVHTAFDATVTWFIDGNISPSKNKVEQASTTASIISNLTVSTRKWKSLSSIACKAEHRCFSTTERTVSVKGHAVRDPSVLIRRSLPQALKDSAVLECHVTQISSSDLYITFQANGTEISEKQFVELPASTDLHSITRRFSVPRNYWNGQTTFTCIVNQGFSSKWVSNSTGKIFGDPSIELLLAPSEDQGSQKLVCSGWGFSPQIQWLGESEKISGPTSDIRMGEDGRVAVTSHLNMPQNEWKTGKIVTCEISEPQLTKKAVSKNISLCSAHQPSPPSINLETPSFKTVMMAESEVTATCVVHTAFDARVTWFIDGKLSPSKKKVEQVSTTAAIISNLTVTTRKWKSLSSIACKADHRCFSTTEKTMSVKGHAVRDPSVLIRRSFPQSLQEDSAVLECHVTQISSRDLYITFQANTTEISDKQFVELPASTDLHSITRRFSVPRNYWNEQTTFTCTVNQGFSSKWVSNSTGKFFGDPSIELLLAPGEDQGSQKLVCSGSGFNPQIQWLAESVKISGPTSDIRMGEDGHVAVTSHLNIPQNEWKTGKIVTCEISDKSTKKTVGQNISLCSAPSSQTVAVFLEGPPLKELQEVDEQVPITCHVVGPNLDSISIRWKVNGTKSSQNSTKVIPQSHSNGTTTIRSILKVPAKTWAAYTQVSCEAKHQCSKQGYEVHISKNRVSVTPSPPSATLLQGSGGLVCLAFGFRPATINITWLLNGSTELQSYNTSEPSRDPNGKFSIHSQLHLPPLDWLPGVVYTCRVTHTTTTLVLNITKPEVLEEAVFFDESRHEPIIQDLEVNWYMAITFLILFLISLLYGTLVTLIKTK